MKERWRMGGLNKVITVILGVHYPISISSPNDIHLHSVFFPWRHKLQILLWYFSFTVGIWWCAATLCWNRHGPSNSPLPPVCFETLWVVSNCLVRCRKKQGIWRLIWFHVKKTIKKKNKPKQISTNLNPKEKLGQLQFCLYMNYVLLGLTHAITMNVLLCGN